MRIFLMNASVSLSSIYAFGSFGTSMNFKRLPDTDISASVRFSLAKFMINLGCSYWPDPLIFWISVIVKRVLYFKWHDRDLILSFTCRLIPFFTECSIFCHFRPMHQFCYFNKLIQRNGRHMSFLFLEYMVPLKRAGLYLVSALIF